MSHKAEPTGGEHYSSEVKLVDDEELQELANDPDIDATPEDDFTIEPGQTVQGERVAAAQFQDERADNVPSSDGAKNDAADTEYMTKQLALENDRKTLYPDLSQARKVLRRVSVEVYQSRPLTVGKEDLDQIRAMLDEIEKRLDLEPPHSG